MKSLIVLVVLSIVISVNFAGQANAGDEIKLMGAIQKIVMTADAAAATVTVTETKSDKTVVITVLDTLTLDKFRDKRIVEGDDIRCKYEVVDGRNISRLFKKTAGC